MAIARIFECRGWTTDQYDEVLRRGAERLGVGPDRSWPGVLFHWGAVTDDGVMAVDVYESREAGDRLAQEHIVPLAQELGLPMPSITEHSVRRILTPSAAVAPGRSVGS